MGFFIKSVVIFGAAILSGIGTQAQDLGAKVDMPYLAHLVKTRIDSVRVLHGCEPLGNDSILFVAAKHHARYMGVRSSMGHYERDSAQAETPALRVAMYGGGKPYVGIGENVIKVPFKTDVKGKKKQYDTRTYVGLADAIVDGWVHSPGHFRNMVTPAFNFTGLALHLNAEEQMIYGCQKFGEILYRFAYSEPKNLFPYSRMEPEKLATSFAQANVQGQGHSHAWGLRHDGNSTCDHCKEVVKNPPNITLRVDGGRFKLRIENSDYVKSLIKNRYDGFAVEIVEFYDYFCGNPAYYEKPSRRNDACDLNGDVLEPVYRKDLYRGYKKRRMIKEITFVKYLLQADSVRFFKRFGQYKVDKFTSEYFEIALGKVPKDTQGLWNHNLVYLQDKKICHVDYFTSYCGAISQSYVGLEMLPVKYAEPLPWQPQPMRSEKNVLFSQGDVRFDKQPLDEIVDLIVQPEHQLDSIVIKAYASVEGTASLNEKLQLARAREIADYLRVQSRIDCPVRVSAETDWDGFYNAVQRYPSLKYMNGLERDSILLILSETDNKALMQILNDQRRAAVTVYYHFTPDTSNLEAYAAQVLKNIEDSIHAHQPNKEVIQPFLDAFDSLYRSLFGLASAKGDGKISPSFLAAVNHPYPQISSSGFCEAFVLAGYQFPSAFAENKSWLASEAKMRTSLMTDYRHEMSPEFLLNECRLMASKITAEGVAGIEEVQEVFDILQLLDAFYKSSPKHALAIEKINFNLNMYLIQILSKGDLGENQKDATKAILQIKSFYEASGQLDAKSALVLGKMAVHFIDNNLAMDILYPFMSTDDEVLAYAMPLHYQHVSSPHSGKFYKSLLDLSDKMDTRIWCNMFMTDCGIPFQAFDHEGLRDVFCEKCMEENVVVRELLGE